MRKVFVIVAIIVVMMFGAPVMADDGEGEGDNTEGIVGNELPDETMEDKALALLDGITIGETALMAIGVTIVQVGKIVVPKKYVPWMVVIVALILYLLSFIANVFGFEAEAAEGIDVAMAVTEVVRLIAGMVGGYEAFKWLGATSLPFSVPWRREDVK